MKRSLMLVLLAPLLMAPECEELSVTPVDAGKPDAPATAQGGCGGEAAAGGYTKGSGAGWDGTAGNAYGYPQDQMPAEDCHGFGFHSTATCTFYDACIILCAVDADCPQAEGGPPPACKPHPTFGSVCVLPCTGTCPTGMECIDHTYGFGDICMWPRHYGKG